MNVCIILYIIHFIQTKVLFYFIHHCTNLTFNIRVKYYEISIIVPQLQKSIHMKNIPKLNFKHVAGMHVH